MQLPRKLDSFHRMPHAFQHGLQGVVLKDASVVAVKGEGDDGDAHVDFHPIYLPRIRFTAFTPDSPNTLFTPAFITLCVSTTI